MSMIANERTKLLATALNNLGVTIVITGVIAPIGAAVYGASPAGASLWWLAIAAAWFFAGIGLHLLAQTVLGSLQP